MGKRSVAFYRPAFPHRHQGFLATRARGSEIALRLPRAQSQSNGKFVSQSVFQAYFGVRGALGERLFQLVAQKRNDEKLTYEDLIISKGTYEKGSRNDIEEFIYQLCDVGGDGNVGRSDLEAVLKSIYETIFSPENDKTGAHSQQETMEVFLNAATFSKQIEGRTEKFMSLADFRNWCNLVPSVRKFLGSLLMPPDSGRPSFQVPQLEHPENFSSEQLILRKEYAWHIGELFLRMKLKSGSFCIIVHLMA
uniref:EF-hand domain-containing protein n=1 Tax=Ananas comosus var. bracteatus TaxID=296719 RepID=A0A6V7QWW6_ANACO